MKTIVTIVLTCCLLLTLGSLFAVRTVLDKHNQMQKQIAIQNEIINDYGITLGQTVDVAISQHELIVKMQRNQMRMVSLVKKSPLLRPAPKRTTLMVGG